MNCPRCKGSFEIVLGAARIDATASRLSASRRTEQRTQGPPTSSTSTSPTPVGPPPPADERGVGAGGERDEQGGLQRLGGREPGRGDVGRRPAGMAAARAE